MTTPKMKLSYVLAAGLLPALGPLLAHAQQPGTTVSGNATGNVYDVRQINLVATGSSSFSATAGFEAVVGQPVAVGGRWSSPLRWTPYNRDRAGEPTGLIGIHTHVLPNGNVLSWEGHNDDNHAIPTPSLVLAHAYEWNSNPLARVGSRTYPSLYTDFDTQASNVFCSGHSFLADGRLLIAGGHYSGGTVYRLDDPNDPNSPINPNAPINSPTNAAYVPATSPWPDFTLSDVNGYIGLRDANTFNFAGDALASSSSYVWQSKAPMTYRRWYPTNTTLGDGSVLVTGGQRYGGPTTGGPPVNADKPEVYLPATSTSGERWQVLAGATRGLPLYPWMFLAPNGQVFNAGPNPDAHFLDPSAVNPGGTLGKWETAVAHPSQLGHLREYGSAVMYAPGKILILGGYDNEYTANPNANATHTVTNTTELIDITDPNAAAAQFVRGPDMTYARMHANATLLADGTVLVTGGAQTNTQAGGGPVYTPELWTPPTTGGGIGTWTAMNPLSIPRLYHSTAVLLPDATVLTTGGGQGGGYEDHPDYQIFTPPYLCKGLARPEIASVPQAVTYGQNFTISSPSADNIMRSGRVTLVRLSSVTHSFNMNQRFLGLTLLNAKNGQLSLKAPDNVNLCPPGHYMLFLIDGSGTPSLASIIKIDTNTCPSLSISYTTLGINPRACDQLVEFTVTGGTSSSAYAWMVNGSSFGASANQTVIQVSTSSSTPTLQVSVKVDNAGCGANATVTSYFPGCVEAQ